jgi:hypothetical protein
MLADGKASSGPDTNTYDPAVTFDTTGPHTASDSSIKDLAGNSTSVTRTVHVDAHDPELAITSCPATVYLNGQADVTVEASDIGSGLASDPSGSATVDSSEAGPQTVSVTATDNVGNSTTRTCTTNVIYRFDGFRQPINSDGSSIFKLGSTVPVKFTLSDANGVPASGAVAELHLVKLTNDVEGEVVEATSTAAASSGNEFRPDGAGGYIFNLGTKSLSKGTWRLKASLDDGTVRTVQISLR